MLKECCVIQIIAVVLLEADTVLFCDRRKLFAGRAVDMTNIFCQARECTRIADDESGVRQPLSIQLCVQLLDEFFIVLR